MLSESFLRKRIEQLREHMTIIAMEKESFVDPEVVAISQQLDVYIVQLQMLMRRKHLNLNMALKEANAS